jgi:hypothetical protein
MLTSVATARPPLPKEATTTRRTGPCGRPGVARWAPRTGRPATPEARPHAGSPRGFDCDSAGSSFDSLRARLVAPLASRRWTRLTCNRPNCQRSCARPIPLGSRPDAFGRPRSPFEASQPAVSFDPTFTGDRDNTTHFPPEVNYPAEKVREIVQAPAATDTG